MLKQVQHDDTYEMTGFAQCQPFRWLRGSPEGDIRSFPSVSRKAFCGGDTPSRRKSQEV
jgi:hypothetical protein